MKPNVPPIVVLFLTLLCFANPLLAQKRSKVNDAVDSLRKCNYVAYIGTDGWGNIPENYTFRQVLARFADDQTLDSLARQHKSSVVKATAGMILIELVMYDDKYRASDTPLFDSQI